MDCNLPVLRWHAGVLGDDGHVGLPNIDSIAKAGALFVNVADEPFFNCDGHLLGGFPAKPDHFQERRHYVGVCLDALLQSAQAFTKYDGLLFCARSETPSKLDSQD